MRGLATVWHGMAWRAGATSVIRSGCGMCGAVRCGAVQCYAAGVALLVGKARSAEVAELL